MHFIRLLLISNSNIELLESLNGIHDIRVNPNAASLIIQYDPTHFPPSLWETLVTGSDHKAAQLIDALLVEHERHLTRR
jgi:hypothetical protein